MTEAQPEVRVWDKAKGIFFKMLRENVETITHSSEPGGWAEIIVHAPDCPTHGQMMFISLKEWDTLERVG